jgi:signal transduction histidine kinase
MNPARPDDPLLDVLRHLFPACPAFRLRVDDPGRSAPAVYELRPEPALPLSPRSGKPGRTGRRTGHIRLTGLERGVAVTVSGPGLPGRAAELSADQAALLGGAVRLFLLRAGHARLERQFDVLCEINREINSQSELKPLVESIAENTARLLDADAVSVMLYDERHERFQTFAGWRSWAAESGAVVFYATEGIIGRVAATLQGVRVADTALSADFKPSADPSQPPIKSMLCVPLVDLAGAQPRLIGVINASRRRFPDRPSKEGFSEQDLSLFEKFAIQVTAAIQRSRVFEETRRRTLQLQTVNQIGTILGSSLERSDNFQRALDLLARSFNLSWAQLLVVAGKERQYNVNLRRNPDFVPPGLAGLLRSGKWNTRSRFVERESRGKYLFSLGQSPSRTNYLYLESRDPLFFEDEHNRRVMETVLDQLAIALENFSLFADVSESNRKMAELDRTKNELISIVSHDFRSPLTVIHAYSELLLLQPEMDAEDRREYLNSIFEQIGHLRRLAEGLLKITRLESGEMTYNFEAIDFAVLAEKFGSRRLPRHQIRFDVEAGLPPLRADYDKLFEVMDNLVSNAIKFSPGGGEVIVRVRRHKDGGALIEVRDQGIGIPPEQVGNLFRKYSRVYNEQTKHIRGTGLGLYICKRLVEGHGGRITVRSKPGEGSAFAFTLPFHGPDPSVP